MPRIRDEVFVRTDIWREGEWLDLWSVVHFLSGMSTGFAIFFFNFAPVPATIIAFLLFTAYEMWEALAHIEETPANRFMDVVVGMVSFLPTYFFLAPRLSESGFISTAGTILIINIVLSVVGWRASKKAAALEKAFRARVEEERERMRARRKRYQRRQKEALEILAGATRRRNLRKKGGTIKE